MRFDIPEKWDAESDVVVVGYGAAGAAAAITAYDKGSSVTILEKSPAGGGNTLISGGGMLCPTDMEFTKYVETLCAGTTDQEIIRTFVSKAMKIGDWFKSVGGDIIVLQPLKVRYVAGPLPKASFPWLPGSEFMVKIRVKEPAEEEEGYRLWKFLAGTVEKRPIKILTNTPAEDLIVNNKGEVIGVRALNAGQKMSIKAKKAVILTCGGFERNEELKRDYLPCWPFFDFGNPGNTGDGIRMAQKVGADLWHMPATSAALGFKSPDYGAAFCVSFISERFIFVNRDGNRFLNETGLEDHELATRVSLFDSARFIYPYIPAYAIFDEIGRKKAPLFEGNSGFNKTIYKWSPDNSVEIDKGWITKGKTIGDLARKISIDESTLVDMISKYNEYCKKGLDPEFNRSRKTLVALDTPPFYAIELYPCLCNTQGGPRRNSEARVLDPGGNPIPRLFSAGEMGSLWGFLYQGSANLSECIVFGEIAGSNAAQEKPWD
ncbi:FAD-binding protein [Chloroflexota bacterium]